MLWTFCPQLAQQSQGGEIGRRAGLKIPFLSGSVGSIPTLGTMPFLFSSDIMRPTIPAVAYAQGTAKTVRQEGKIPAVLYGKAKETKNVAIDKQAFRKAYKVAGKATLMDVTLDKETIPSLVHLIDLHPVSGDPMHVDFHAVNMDEPVHAVVPVKTTGVSDAVKLLGGVLTTMTTEVEIKCLPKDLLSSVTVDLSALKTFHDHITVGDITFPEAITVLTPADMTVASVIAPRLGNDAEEEAEEGETEEATEEAKTE